MWKMVRYSADSYALEYNGQIIVISRSGTAARALIDFGTIVANEMQATPA